MAPVPTLDDVKAHLNITSAIGDTELQGVLDASVSVVEGMVGAISSVQYTETYDGGAASIFVRHPPLLSIQSITEFYGNATWPLTLQPIGSSTDSYGYSLDSAEWGQVTRRGASSYPTVFAGSYPAGFGFGGSVVITYTAGRATIPAGVRLAILVVAAELWSTQRGAAPLPSLGPGLPGPSVGPDWTGAASIPPLARQLCQGSGLMRGPSIA